MDYKKQFEIYLQSGVPIIAFRSSDYAMLIESLSKGSEMSTRAILKWDINRGVVGVNKDGAAAAVAVNGGEPAATTTANPQEALTRALDLMPKKSVLFMENAHVLLESREEGNRLTAIQSVMNCRNPFEASSRTLVLLCPDIKLPLEISHSVMVLDHPLPTRGDLENITKFIFKSGGMPDPDKETIDAAVDATTGLSAFLAKNSIAVSLTKNGLDFPMLWERKISSIEQTAGLSVSRDKVSFDDIGGLEQVKGFCKMKLAGKRRPRGVVLIDEIGDQMAGLNDSNGLNRDAQAQMLSCMQNFGWGGMLLHGVAGTGKTEIGKAMGCEADGLFLTFDLGGMKGGIVGDSEKMIRAAMSVLWAMFGRDCFFIGTTNSVAGLTPQIKRRFGTTFFFDLLKEEQQAPIWSIYRSKLNITSEIPECSGWTGAEIRKCCELADEFGVSLEEASRFITPVVKAMGKGLEEMRKEADGRYLSACEPGYYKHTNRKVLNVERVMTQISKKDSN